MSFSDSDRYPCWTVQCDFFCSSYYLEMIFHLASLQRQSTLLIQGCDVVQRKVEDAFQSNEI